jgi:hypothetical protein
MLYPSNFTLAPYYNVMRRPVLVISLAFFLFQSIITYAYVGMPLTKLSEKGVALSALPGIYNGPLTLSAKMPLSIELMLSLDGNIPTAANAFDRPISLSKTVPITIALKENGKLSDTLYFGTYLIGFSSTLPITSLILPPSDLFDPNRGIYVGGLTESGERWGNCWGDLERQAFFELIQSNKLAMAQSVGLRIFGGMTRQNAEKSLRVIARKKYGKGKFKYRVFPTKNIDEFNSLVLRVSGNDWLGTRFQDMMISSLAKDIGVDYTAYQPSVLFVNGEYWGIHNIREKINISYLETNHGADATKSNLISGLGSSATHGSIASYKELFNFLSNTDPNEAGFVDSVEKRMDVDNYFKYIALQVHINNPDSRGNVRYWEANNLDSRFRWIYYDGDLGFGGPGVDYLKFRLSPVETAWHNPPSTTFLLRHLTANPELRDRFISQYSMLLSTWLHADTIGNRIGFFTSWLEPEIERHLKRKNFNQSKNNWLSRIKRLDQFAEARMPAAYQHLSSNFQLGSTYQLGINSSLSNDIVKFYIERIPVPSLPYKGKYFKDVRVNVEVDILHPRYQFISWENGSIDRKRLVLNSKDSILNISAKVEKTPPSISKDKIWINSIGHGKKDQPRFIEINGWGTHKDSVILVDSKKYFSITLSLKKMPLVITEDTLTFRRLFPNTNIDLIAYPNLPLKKLGPTLYLTEPSGAWIDSIDLLAWDSINRKEPYWIRSEDGKFTLSKKAPKFMPPQKPWYKGDWMLPLIGILIASVAGIIYYMKRRKRSVTVNVLLIVLLATFQSANAQEEGRISEKFRRVDVELLRHSSLVFKGPNEIQQQSGFYRTYKPISELVSWIAPFNSKDLATGNWQQAYTIEAFKELPTDNFRVRHMKFMSVSASCWIAGMNKEFFLIDSVKKLYLVRIEHKNGLESWYYPIVNPNLTADVSIPGSKLGMTAGFYFWQIRYRTCSLLASAIIESNGSPDPKGFVLENVCPLVNDPSARVKNFSKALYDRIAEQGINVNWEKALENELKPKQ